MTFTGINAAPRVTAGLLDRMDGWPSLVEGGAPLTRHTVRCRGFESPSVRHTMREFRPGGFREKKKGCSMTPRRTILGILTALALALTATTALADSPHYRRGPSCVANGFTVTCTGVLTGLGNGNVIVTVEFPDATATTICTNPGSNFVPGQNPAAPVTVEGSALITKIKNGTVGFTVTTNPPPAPTSAQAGCPNGNWTASIDEITFGTGFVTVQQETFQGSGIYEVVIGPTPVTV